MATKRLYRLMELFGPVNSHELCIFVLKLAILFVQVFELMLPEGSSIEISGVGWRSCTSNAIFQSLQEIYFVLKSRRSLSVVFLPLIVKPGGKHFTMARESPM